MTVRSPAGARGRDELLEATLSFAGHQVLARIAGRELAVRTLRPFAHLVEPAPGPGAPALTVDLREDAVAGVARRRSRRTRVRSSADGRWAARADATSVFVLDRLLGRIRGAVADGARLVPDQLSKPLPVVLPLWYLDRSVTVVHAGAVADERGAVLLAGPPRAGKSTTALSCGAAGFAFLGDDQVGIEPTGVGFRVHSLYATARLDESQCARHPGLPAGAPVQDVGDDKLLLFVGESPSVPLARSARVRALALLDGASDAAVRRATPVEALLALAPTSLVGVVGGGALGLARLGELVERVPAFVLGTREPSALPVLVSSLLDES